MIIKTYDVAIIGGGTAGVAAAVAASQNGADTVLIEAGPMIGGEAISGLPLLGCRNALGEWIVGGVIRQLLDRADRLGGYTGSFFDWRLMWGTCVDPVVMQVAIAETLQEHNVSLLLHSSVTAPVLNHNVLSGVIVNGKCEQTLILAKTFIDASGDASIAHMAGVPCVSGDGTGDFQPVSMTFRMANVDIPELLDFVRNHPEDVMLAESPVIAKTRTECAAEVSASGTPFFSLDVEGPLLKEAVASGALFPSAGFYFTPNSEVRKELAINVTRIAQVNGVDTEELSSAYYPLLNQVKVAVQFLKESVPGFKQAILSGLAPKIGIRETRRILGERTLTTEQVVEGIKDPEGVAKGSHHVDIHGEGTFQLRTPVKGGGSYDIPYGCLVPLNVEQLLIAGRCLSSSREANASARVSGTCMATGEAAGTAAALAVKEQVSVRKLDAEHLRKTLASMGAVIGGTR